MSGRRKPERPTVACRVPLEVKEALEEKHPTPGELSKVLNLLIKRYLDGKILGIRVEQSNPVQQ